MPSYFTARPLSSSPLITLFPHLSPLLFFISQHLSSLLLFFISHRLSFSPLITSLPQLSSVLFLTSHFCLSPRFSDFSFQVFTSFGFLTSYRSSFSLLITHLPHLSSFSVFLTLHLQSCSRRRVFFLYYNLSDLLFFLSSVSLLG